MVQVVIEHDHIARLAFERNSGNIAPMHAEVLLRATNAAYLCDPGATEDMAAGNDAQAAGVPCHRVEIERYLNVQAILMPPIRVPTGVAGIVVAVAANVVEILTEQAGGGFDEFRMIEQGRETCALVDEWHYTGALRPIVLGALVVGVNGCEFFGDPANLLAQLAWQHKEAERLEEVALLRRQRHDKPS